MALPPQMWLASMNVVSFLGSVMHVDVSAVAVVDWYTYALFIDIVTLSGPVCLLMMRRVRIKTEEFIMKNIN
ncbi:hypothetical protein AAVH_26931 [Aphelenchoides avenae]|nr:hypothetical protein AAVH_26931 [Aphelenchus avenae]